MASGVPRELIAGSSFYSFRGSDGYKGPPFPITTKLETLMKGWHINALYNTNGFYNCLYNSGFFENGQACPGNRPF